MLENKQPIQKSKTKPYLFYFLISVVFLLFSVVILCGLTLFLIHALLDIIICSISPYGYYKEKLSYKKYLHLHRFNPVDVTDVSNIG